MESPKTLQQAILFFSNEDNCIAYVRDMRWPDGVVICPFCGRNDVSWLKSQKKWQCKSKHSKRQFSAKVGTIFEDSPIALDKWLMAAWMLTNCKNGISSYELAKDIGLDKLQNFTHSALSNYDDPESSRMEKFSPNHVKEWPQC
jgi:hypothetical protein